MREQEAAPSRRRRKSPPKEKAKARKFDIKEIFGELRTAFKIFNIVAALVTLYVIASLYTPWTGDAGAATALNGHPGPSAGEASAALPRHRARDARRRPAPTDGPWRPG